MADMQRAVLPIPDQPHVGLLTYDAKDPDTSFPPIEPLLPPEGAPNVLVVLLDDVGFGAVERRSAVRSTCRRPSGCSEPGSPTTASTRPRCVRRPAPRCSADATITRSGWA